MAIAATVWGAWVMYLVVTMPYSPVRLFFSLIVLIPGLLLMLIQIPALRNRFLLLDWGAVPATVRFRQILHLWLAWALGMIAVAICVGDTTRPIHCIPYVAVAFIHAGKALRLAYYDR